MGAGANTRLESYDRKDMEMRASSVLNDDNSRIIFHMSGLIIISPKNLAIAVISKYVLDAFDVVSGIPLLKCVD